jgi:ATP-dependent DNA helicase RecG
VLPDERLQELELSERQLKAIAFVKSQGHISNTEYQDVTGVSKRTATRKLNELMSKDVLVSEGGSRGRGRLYRLKTI